MIRYSDSYCYFLMKDQVVTSLEEAVQKCNDIYDSDYENVRIPAFDGEDLHKNIVNFIF